VRRPIGSGGHRAAIRAIAERIRDTADIRREMRADAEALSIRIAPWDSAAEVERIAVREGLAHDAATIETAMRLVRESNVGPSESGLPGWGPE